MTTTKQRILIVDDEISFTRLLKLNLEQAGGYEAHVENLASRAVAAALQFRPDLALLDVMMPGLDGGSVAAQLQGHAATKDIPIVFLTAAVRKEEVATHQGQIGGLSYIAKPVDFNELLKFIGRLLAQVTAAKPGVARATPSASGHGAPPSTAALT